MNSRAKEMEWWIEQSKKIDASGFVAFSINEKGAVCFRAECSAKQLVAMLACGCEDNPIFKTILQTYAKSLIMDEGGNNGQ